MIEYDSVGVLLENYFKALNALKEVGITPNKKDFTSQVGEWLISEIYSGIRAKNSIQKDWDIEIEGRKIQVKTHSKALSNKSRHSLIKHNLNAEIDQLIIVVFSEKYDLNEFYSIPWRNALPLIRQKREGDRIYWNHLKDFKIELNDLPNQSLIDLFRTSRIS